METKKKTTAIAFDLVSKRYRLGGSPNQLLIEALGLARFFGKPAAREDFLALDSVTFKIGRGERVGLVGRNGAGKTTLLKLIAGNYAPTSGTVHVQGTVQALMTMGQGFHPDYTGRDNINASLQYNGLSKRDLKHAFEDVVEFCELGAFLDQPFKTYSSGMQARLMFATATAISPEILIIDEVLGAGDAYFLAKSKRRVEALVGSGCTLLLVSHSMAQVLELCERVVWLDGGRVQADGAAFPIVKAYEEAMYGAPPGTGDPLASRRAGALRGKGLSLPATARDEVAPDQPGTGHLTESPTLVLHGQRRTHVLQQPAFQPHAEDVEIPAIPDSEGRLFRNLAPGGISRWASQGGLAVTGLSVSGPAGPTDRLVTMQPARLTLFLQAEADDEFRCTYGFAIHDLQGRAVARCFSPPDRFAAGNGDGRRVEMLLNPLQIGPGIYTIGVSVLHETTIEDANSADRFDLLSRSFIIEVAFPDSMSAMLANFVHTSEWTFGRASIPSGQQGEGRTETRIESMQACPFERATQRLSDVGNSEHCPPTEAKHGS
ncbi:lipopolysaccharide transport system ATP-binding protein [Bradyrhizobium elkanii]|uniref:ABC transporter ATP-binding protein n=1 Tax=Bradyrhizobium elkanii TaxID=29448 RepID=UPI003516BECF